MHQYHQQPLHVALQVVYCAEWDEADVPDIWTIVHPDSAQRVQKHT